MNRRINALQTCTAEQTKIVNAIQNKTIDATMTVKLPNVSIYVGDGWYEVTTPGAYVLAYINKSDSNYDYEIMIVKTPYVTIGCDGVIISKNNKDGTPATDTSIPPYVINSALSTFPSSTTCGTGLWNGCIAGVQNKYLIVGGGLLAGLLLLTKK